MTRARIRPAFGRGALLAVLLMVPGCGEQVPPPVAGAATGADAATYRVVFEKAAAQTGLEFRHFIGATGEHYFPETVGPGGALIDYDGDGDLDVYLVQGALLAPDKRLADALFGVPPAPPPRNRLFRNELVERGALHFSDVTDAAGVGDQGYAIGAAAGDFDNDGDVDLYVTNFGPNTLYRNDGNGRFTDITAASGADDARWSSSAAFVDYDRDGNLDLFVTNYVAFSLEAHKRCTNPLGSVDYCGPNEYGPVPDRLFRNDGAGRFTDVSAAAGLDAAFGAGLGVTAADFNADGWPDLYVANDGLANQLWINRGDGSFENGALMSGSAFNADGNAEASMGVTAGDFDGDGDEDLFMTHLVSETNTLYLNDGAGDFVDATDQLALGNASRSFTGFGTASLDFDNDGRLDLFVANGAVSVESSQAGVEPYPYLQKNQLFRNGPDGRFTEVSAASGAAMQLLAVSRGAAFGDIDNDGDVDIVVFNNNGPAHLLLNVIGNQRHWLSVRLQGVTSNREGAGARVAVLRSGQPPLWRRAHRDGSYASSSDIRVHFGLGDDPALNGVAVRWPSGRNEVWRSVTADSFVTLEEGTGEPWDEPDTIMGSAAN